MEENVVLKMRNINKNFPGVVALEDVSFTLRSGEIHALMGENGAGKSTLIKVLTGVEEFETGTINIAGIKGNVINKTISDAQKNGISTVYQEINLCPNLSVAENLFIGREPKILGFIDRREMNKKAKKLLESLDINIEVTKPLEKYSLAIQQMIAIARAIDMSAKILILDEPTSSLDEEEVEKLFEFMKMLRKNGVGIIFVTHFLEQVYEVCDKITVLRNGTFVGEYDVASLPRYELVAKMLGKNFDDLESIKSPKIKEDKKCEMYLSAKKLSHSGKIKPFNLDIKKGEVVGLTGLLGSGRSELARVIYGADKPTSGELELCGKKVNITNPLKAMKSGMGYLPEDRKTEGIFADLSVRENIMLALQSKKGILNLLSKKQQEEFADKYIELLSIKTASKETLISQLSGGNQQKVILARWLLTNPDFLILDEPTRGIDVGTKTEIQKLVIKLADEGKSVIFISSEIDEMLRTCNKMAVLRDGEKVGELTEDKLNQNDVMKAIAGGEKNAQS